MDQNRSGSRPGIGRRDIWPSIEARFSPLITWADIWPSTRDRRLLVRGQLRDERRGATLERLAVPHEQGVEDELTKLRDRSDGLVHVLGELAAGEARAPALCSQRVAGDEEPACRVVYGDASRGVARRGHD